MTPVSNLLNILRAAILATAAVLLGACGQKGPLVHPDVDAAKYKDTTTRKTSAQTRQPSSSNAAPAPTDTPGAAAQ